MSNEERTWGMLCHLSTFSGSFFPFGTFLGPLVVWLIKKEEYPLVEDQGKESLNFQISVAIYGIICIPLMLIVIGFFLLAALFIFDIVLVIMASIEANKGERYRYPLTIRFIK